MEPPGPISVSASFSIFHQSVSVRSWQSVAVDCSANPNVMNSAVDFTIDDPELLILVMTHLPSSDAHSNGQAISCGNDKG